MTARVVGIFIAPEEGAAVVSLDQVKALAGRGLEGDRYSLGPVRASQEITLIESEKLEDARRDRRLDLAPGEHRRNIVTQGVDLAALVGTSFKLGEAEVEAIRPNPPCRYLEEVSGQPVREGLGGWGGVRGRIATSGLIRVGDFITL